MHITNSPAIISPFEHDIVLLLLAALLLSKPLSDYSDMIASFKRMPSKPRILLMVPPPLYRNGVYGMNQTVINSIFPAGPGVAASVRGIAKTAGLSAPLVDLFSLFQRHCPVTGGTPGHPNNDTDVNCDWVGSGGADGCHPNDIGYGQVATLVAAAIHAAGTDQDAGRVVTIPK
eukprot:SAG22_NODE_1932_length_3292_cov_1.713749_2_plen_174_part_00